MSVSIIDNGDLFATEADAIVNPVNCVGVMGKGLALAFKNKFPANNLAYQTACTRHDLKPGGLHVFDRGILRTAQEGGPRYIVNLATKDHWRDDSKIEWIRSGSIALEKWAAQQEIKSIACPALGAGNGNLKWEKVKIEVMHAFRESPVALVLFAPLDAASTPRPIWKPR